MQFHKMKKITLLIITAFILVCTHDSYTQNILELPYKPIDKEFDSLTKTLKEIGKTDDQRSIDLCIAALGKY